MAKTTRVAMNEWTLINGIGCDVNVTRGKSGELIAVEMMRADTMKLCNVAFIGMDGDSIRTFFRAGYNKDSAINGKLTRGAMAQSEKTTGSSFTWYLIMPMRGNATTSLALMPGAAGRRKTCGRLCARLAMKRRRDCAA